MLSTSNSQRCAGARGGGAGNKADVKFTAQNGMTANSKPVLTNSCKNKHGKKGKGAKKGGAGKKAKGSSRTIAWLPGLGF